VLCDLLADFFGLSVGEESTLGQEIEMALEI
jgi:hypothetical protein